MDNAVAFLVEWKAHDGKPPEDRKRVQLDDSLEPWLIHAGAKVTPLYKRDSGSASDAPQGIPQ